MPPAEKPRGSSRFDPMWLLLVAAALFLGRVGLGVWETYNPPAKAEKVKWVDFDRAQAVAAGSGRPILYDFSAEWCAPCQQMKEGVFADARLAKALEASVVPVRVIDRMQEEGRNPAWIDSLQKQWRVDGFPTLVVYSPKTGRSLMSTGYGGPERTLRWISQSAYAVQSGVAPDGSPLH